MTVLPIYKNWLRNYLTTCFNNAKTQSVIGFFSYFLIHLENTFDSIKMTYLASFCASMASLCRRVLSSSMISIQPASARYSSFKNLRWLSLQKAHRSARLIVAVGDFG